MKLGFLETPSFTFPFPSILRLWGGASKQIALAPESLMDAHRRGEVSAFLDGWFDGDPKRMIELRSGRVLPFDRMGEAAPAVKAWIIDRHGLNDPARLLVRVAPDAPGALLEGLKAAEQVRPFIGAEDNLPVRLGDPAALDMAHIGTREVYGLRDVFAPDRLHVSVQVAFTSGYDNDFPAVLHARDKLRGRPNTAQFYSISNWKAGDPVRGFPMGERLIIAVAGRLQEDQPDIGSFITFSPIPSFAPHVAKLNERAQPLLERAFALTGRSNTLSVAKFQIMLGKFGWQQEPGLVSSLEIMAAGYLLARGRDPVAGFHLGNGAVLRHVANADPTPIGIKNAHGIMGRYGYKSPDQREANVRRYKTGDVPHSDEVADLLGDKPAERARTLELAKAAFG